MTNIVKKEERLNTLIVSPNIKMKFDEVLKHNAPAFISSVISAVNANDRLMEAQPMSVIHSAMVIASLDLQVNPSLGQAHIVPFKKNGVPIATPQLGWKGYVQLALRSGQYQTINASEVFEGEISHHNRITGDMKFEGQKKSDKVEGYVLYFRLTNNFEKYFYMTAEECQAHGKRYAPNNPMWKSDFKSMALKTVVKMGLSKYGPLSTKMQKALEIDQAEVNGEGGVISYPDAPSPEKEPEAPKKTHSSKLSSIIDAKATPTTNSNEQGSNPSHVQE